MGLRHPNAAGLGLSSLGRSGGLLGKRFALDVPPQSQASVGACREQGWDGFGHSPGKLPSYCVFKVLVMDSSPVP